MGHLNSPSFQGLLRVFSFADWLLFTVGLTDELIIELDVTDELILDVVVYDVKNDGFMDSLLTVDAKLEEIDNGGDWIEDGFVWVWHPEFLLL